MVESIKSLAKNIDVSKNSSSNIDKVDKLNASSVSQKPAVDTVDISGSLPASTLADFKYSTLKSFLNFSSLNLLTFTFFKPFSPFISCSSWYPLVTFKSARV